MPLMKGSSSMAKAFNIKAELKAGRPRAQAIAIALSEAREAEKKKRGRR